MSGPKPGDPDFVPRHPVIDLDAIELRVTERAEYARTLPEGSSVRPVLEGDTEIMRDLVREVRNLREANALLRAMVRAAIERRQSAT